MRRVFRYGVLLCLVVTLLPAAAAVPVAAQPEVVADDELVILDRDGRILVRDPYTPPGYVQLSWTSPVNGFGRVATGDFNGDGTDEIVGLRYNQAIVYDPNRQPGEADVARTFEIASNLYFQFVVTGAFWGGTRDGLVLIHSYDQPNQQTRMLVYSFDSASNTWTQNYVQAFGAAFQALAAGDVDGDNRDELAVVRNAGAPFNQILIFDPSQNWATSYEGNYNYPWSTIAIGNIQGDGENKDEIATTRSGVGSNLASFLVFRWINSATLQDVAAENFNPNFTAIALGDVSANGDDEVFLLRPGVSGGVNIVALTSRFDDGSYQFNELAGQTRFLNLITGDVDADGRDELIVMAADEYLIYTEPVASAAFTPYPGSYSTSLSMAAGNLDGNGIPQGPRLSVSPTTVNRAITAGQSGTQAIQITNTGTGTLNWTASVTQGANWLSVQPTSGTAPATATLTMNASALTAGTYVGRVRISGQAGVVGSPVDVTVNLTVTAPAAPRLSIDPTSITLSVQSGQSSTQQVQIANTGAGTLSWTAALINGSPWLSFSPSSGTAPGTLTLTLDAVSLQAGQYTGTVRVTGAAGTVNSPQDISVNLTVTAPPAPRLSVAPTEIDLTLESGQSETSPIQIGNTGAGSLSWTAALIGAVPWLTFSPSSDTAPSTMTAAISAVDLQPGQYSGKIRITGASGVQNSPQDVTVNLTVTAPAFSVTPNLVTWIYIPPGSPGSRSVTVTGAGVRWHAGVVPMDSLQRVQAAIDAGRQMAIGDGLLALGDGGEDVPVVIDYIDISPSSGTANQTGVTLSLVPARVPYGLSQVAIVFVADNIADPPAVVVRASVLRTLDNGTDLRFLPLVVASQ